MLDGPVHHIVVLLIQLLLQEVVEGLWLQHGNIYFEDFEHKQHLVAVVSAAVDDSQTFQLGHGALREL